MAAKIATAIRLSPEAAASREVLAEHWGCDLSAVIERCLRDAVKREGLRAVVAVRVARNGQLEALGSLERAMGRDKPIRDDGPK